MKEIIANFNYWDEMKNHKTEAYDTCFFSIQSIPWQLRTNFYENWNLSTVIENFDWLTTVYIS